jgi:hypothetical protein
MWLANLHTFPSSLCSIFRICSVKSFPRADTFEVYLFHTFQKQNTDINLINNYFSFLIVTFLEWLVRKHFEKNKLIRIESNRLVSWFLLNATDRDLFYNLQSDTDNFHLKKSTYFLTRAVY